MTKFYPKYQNERGEIQEQLQNSTHIIPNLPKAFQKYFHSPPKLWTCRELKVVEGLQKLLFPEGI
jgi:hypothetical protein